MSRDPYLVLDLRRDAGPAEIKRAYRRLAMRWHPDRNDAPEATERFKQIRAAYERLTAVDRPAAVETEPAETAADSTPAADIRLNLEITLEEAAAGCRKHIHYTRSRTCTTCAGSGEAGISRSRFCGACHGSGRVSNGRQGLRPCTECNGRGMFSERTCPDCGGSGRHVVETELAVSVPPGMLPGDDLRVAGQGELGNAGQRPGDLYLTLLIREHAWFELRGRDLHLAMPVSALALIAGGSIEIPTLDGRIACELEPGRPQARELRLAGRGYPGTRGRSPAGDLVVHLAPDYPAQLDARQRKLLLQADAALQAGDALPGVAAWRRKIDEKE